MAHFRSNGNDLKIYCVVSIPVYPVAPSKIKSYWRLEVIVEWIKVLRLRSESFASIEGRQGLDSQGHDYIKRR